MFVDAWFRVAKASDRRRGGRHLAILAGRLLREPGPGPADMACGASSPPTRMVISAFAALSRRAIRSRSTGRSETSCVPRAATTCGRRICISRHQGRIQDAGLAALRPGRQVLRHRRAVRRDAPSDRRLHPPRERESPAPTSGRVEFARLHPRHGAGPYRSPPRPPITDKANESGRRSRSWCEKRSPSLPGRARHSFILPKVIMRGSIPRMTDAVSSRRRPRVRPRPRSGRTGSHALPASDAAQFGLTAFAFS